MSCRIFVAFLSYVAIVCVADSHAESFSWTDWSVGESLNKTKTRTRAVLKKVETCESCYEEQLEVQTQTSRRIKKSVENIALKKIASSSSIYPHYPYGRPALAIDGDTNGNFFYGSCMCTDLDHNPWLRIDLEGTYIVDEVIVYNRVDCCPTRADNLTVIVEERINGTTSICGRKSNMNVKAARFDCVGRPAGRYIHISLYGRQYLTLCEVQVFGVTIKEKELARGKNGTASSTYNPIAGAVDGDLGQDFETACSETNPWMMIDLGADAYISKVYLYRSESEIENLKDSTVTIGGRGSMESCGVASSSTVVARGDYKFYKVACKHICRGRYVRIALIKSSTYIVIRELQVYGQFV